MEGNITISKQTVLLVAVAFLGGGGIEPVAAIAGLSPTVRAIGARLSDERAGFTKEQERVLSRICGFPGPIRDPEPRPRPEDPR